jgi:hypothetical protein
MRVAITTGEQRFPATLTDSATARDLVARLPAAPRVSAIDRPVTAIIEASDG